MTPQKFAKAFYDEKENLLDYYFKRRSMPYEEMMREHYIATLIKELKLNVNQQELLFKIVDGALRDALYTILLGLGGCTSIGNEVQQRYEVYDKSGNQLTDGLDGYAYDYFHGATNM